MPFVLFQRKPWTSQAMLDYLWQGSSKNFESDAFFPEIDFEKYTKIIYGEIIFFSTNSARTIWLSYANIKRYWTFA